MLFDLPPDHPPLDVLIEQLAAACQWGHVDINHGIEIRDGRLFIPEWWAFDPDVVRAVLAP